MRDRPHQKAATLSIKDADGNQIQVSAILHQDRHYLLANRIELIGSRDKELELIGLNAHELIDWEIKEPTDESGNDDSVYSYRQSGIGLIRSYNMTSAGMASEDTVQPYADIQIVETHDRVSSERQGGLNLNSPRAEYIFLQRPRGWHVPKRNWRAPDMPRRTGQWRSIKSLGVRFRLMSVAQIRDDDRTAQEIERIELPGIEMSPIDSTGEEARFFEAADSLWFVIRALLVFRFRQVINPFSETKIGSNSRGTVWHDVRLEQRRYEDEDVGGPFFGNLEAYLSKGATALVAHQEMVELFHAAAYGYASSYKPGAMENSLADCIAGVERLVKAFEQARGLTRELVEPKRWKKLTKKIRREANPLATNSDEKNAINRALSGVPTMLLIERMRRMANALSHRWRKESKELLLGAEGMVNARNIIVHGRMISDYDGLQIEILRAQTLFERLWLGFLRCGDLRVSTWPMHSIHTYDLDHAAKTSS